MNSRTAVPVLLLPLILPLLAWPSPAGASSMDAMNARIEVLEGELRKLREERTEADRRQEILTTEVRKVRDSLVLPERPELKSQFGMGPAASKVYGTERGLSIGGYGQAWYTALVEDKAQTNRNTFDFKRFVLYTGYKFNDWIILNSEIEFEHATTSNTGNGAGSVSVEFAQLDFLLHEKFNVRAGLLLVPVGLTNEIHEPNFYHGNERPEPERQVIPTTWRANGIGAFGQLGDKWSYRAYLLTSLNAARFSDSGIRGGRQNGNRSTADDTSLALRVDYQADPHLSLGGSIYTGDQGQEQRLTVATGTFREPEVDMTLYELHAKYRRKGLELRGLYTRASIEDAAVLSAARARTGLAGVPEVLKGYYGEVAYDVAPHLGLDPDRYLALFYRYEFLDTHAEDPFPFPRIRTGQLRLQTVGVTYKPDPQVVLKLDHRDFSREVGTRADEVNLGLGWVF